MNDCAVVIGRAETIGADRTGSIVRANTSGTDFATIAGSMFLSEIAADTVEKDRGGCACTAELTARSLFTVDGMADIDNELEPSGEDVDVAAATCADLGETPLESEIFPIDSIIFPMPVPELWICADLGVGAIGSSNESMEPAFNNVGPGSVKPTSLFPIAVTKFARSDPDSESELDWPMSEPIGTRFEGS